LQVGNCLELQHRHGPEDDGEVTCEYPADDENELTALDHGYG